MSLKIYKLEPGQCVFVASDPTGLDIGIEVRKVSGLEAVLDPARKLRENQYLYGTLKVRDLPGLALQALVVTSSASGTLVQWCHGKPRDADKLDKVLSGCFEPPAPAAKAQPTKVEATKPPLVAQEPVRADASRADAPKVDVQKAETVSAESPKVVAPQSVAPKAPSVVVRRPDVPAEPLSTLELLPAAPATAGEADPSDMAARIRKKAKVVRASDLASRLSTVQVLSTGMIKGLIKEAVEEATALLGSSLQEAERRRLLEESEAGFAERLDVFKAEKAGLEQKSAALEAQLQKAQSLLEEERTRVVSASQFTVSDAGMIEIEQRLGRLFDRAVKSGGVSAELEHDMRAVLCKLLDDEREKIRSQAQEAQNDRIALLEKKVSRLAGSLESAELERDKAQRRAQALEASGGLALRNVYEVGLDEDDPAKDKKLTLLKQIYEFNQEVRRKLEAEGRLPRKLPAPMPEAAVPTPAVSEPAAKAVAEAPREPVQEPKSAAIATVEVAPAPVASASVEYEEEAAGDEPVPVLAGGGEPDPDDLPWTPSEEPVSLAAQGKIRRLG